MDSLTHIVVGACIGEVIAGKQLGKKALFIGAIANSIPDIDFVASFWMPVTKDLLAHRGFTHSILFVLLLTPLLVFCSGKLFRKNNIPVATWALFWGVELFTHLFIDSFNTYGTGLFEPFSHYRVSFDTMFVADPLFSIWPFAAFIILFVIKTGNKNRKTWAWAALALSTAYLALGIMFKLMIDKDVKEDLNNKNLVTTRRFTTPTPLNNLLWYIVAECDSGYYIGYRSVLDKKAAIDYHFAPRNDSLVFSAGHYEDVARLLRFSKGYYTMEDRHDTIIFNNLRFGEIAGWEEAKPEFVFHYYLQYPDDNKMVVQRGRFSNWNKRALTSFITRIKGI